jgi:hypothetical protein
MRCTPYKVYARGMHAHEMHAREMHAHKVHAYECTPIRCTPMRCTPIRGTPVNIDLHYYYSTILKGSPFTITRQGSRPFQLLFVNDCLAIIVVNTNSYARKLPRNGDLTLRNWQPTDCAEI